MSFLGELKRRNVFRAAAAYVAVAWLLIQVAETTFPAFGFGDAALRNLIVVLAVGFVPAVALSWAFELTPHGLRRDRDIEPGSELALRTRRMLDRGILVVLALGVAYFAFDKFVLDPARDEALVEEARQAGRTEALVQSYGENSIAVLPFTNMSADPGQDYFGDGMAEEVLNLLARIPELRVISRSSAFTYKGKDKKLSEIAEELDVAHILEGSVRRAGNRVRVTAQLIEARSDTHLWSQSWERELEDVFAIQDEIAADVVARLELTLLGPVPRAQRVDPRAYELYMQGRFLIETNDLQQLVPALDAMRSAIEIAPGYAKAWAGLAWVYYRYHQRQRSAPIPGAPMSSDEARSLYRDAVARALALDPDDPNALSMEGWWYSRNEPDFARAARLHERALAAGTGDAGVLASAGVFAYNLGNTSVGTRLMEAAVRRDPFCSWCQWTLADVYLYQGRIAEAEELVLKLKKRGVTVPQLLEFGLLRAKGDYDAALQILEQRDSARPETLAARADLLLTQGRPDEARAILQTLVERWGEAVALDIAGLYGALGEQGRVIEWLEKDVAANGCRRLQINFGIVQRAMLMAANDPRWQELTRRCGVSPEQIAAIGFDPKLPE